MGNPNRCELPVSVLLPKGTSPQLALGIGVDGETVVVVGGQGRDLFFCGSGARLLAKPSPGPGLRGCFVRGDDIWVVGEYRYIAHSPDRGETWESLNGARRPGCLYNAIEDRHGHIWAAGDGGWLAHAADGSTFTELAGVREKIARITRSRLGILAPTSYPGCLYIVDGTEIRKTSLEAATELMKATMTPRGTIIAVGRDGAVFRSTDEGASYSRIDVDSDALLTSVDHLPDGRIIVVGLGGVIRTSTDDGATFQAVAHELGSTDLWCSQPQFDTMLVGGQDGLLLRLGTRGARTNAPALPVPGVAPLPY